MQNIKMLAFDLDGTLTPSKQSIREHIARRLIELLKKYKIAVIGGGKFELFKKHLAEKIIEFSGNREVLRNLYLFPTCSSSFYRFNGKEFRIVYEEKLFDEEIKAIEDAFRKMIEKFELYPDELYGKQVENRQTQITFSMFGQQAPLGIKEKWDPDRTKRQPMIKHLQKIIPGFEVRIGGTTSIDVTRKGIDKAYGMRKIMAIFGLSKSEVIFFGDSLMEGGNDYPVKKTGIKCVEVRDDEDTLEKLKGF